MYISDKDIQYGKKKLDDYRSAVGKDYTAARYQNKNQMLRQMLKRAINSCFSFTHVIADSWFGNKENIKAVVSSKLVGIFRMKRGNLQYLLNGNSYTATALYALIKRRLKNAKEQTTGPTS